MDWLIVLKMLLLPIAVWRLYRLFARETGPRRILKRLRIKLGVRYNEDFTDWSANEGSVAELILCPKCSTIWLGGMLTLLLLFVPDWLYYLVVLPFNASGLAIIFEALVWAPHEYSWKKSDEVQKSSYEPCF